MQIIIPEVYREILEKDQFLKGTVYTTFSKYSDILSENRLFFFEEYTDHGIEHINSVLETTSNIIPIDSINKFDPINITCLLLSILIHDLGMHLSVSGFRQLLKRDEIISKHDKKLWNSLWLEYLDEAKRFSEKERIQLFGDPNWMYKQPDLNSKDSLTGIDKKLIGEFIRRHHARIAHEISIFGYPINETESIEFASELESDSKYNNVNNLIGIIARSHNLSLRDTFNSLKDKFYRAWKKPRGIKVIFLMVILRISDYFQIDINRTKLYVDKYKDFNSPYSKQEFKNHLSTIYLSEDTDDPESLWIECAPPDITTYIRLKKLFNSIQNELDRSWAVLGEIYGRERDEHLYKIKFRRIRSNLDLDNEYSKNLTYIDDEIRIKTSPDVTNLLIGPLYGGNPSYGIRELIQNSVDACIEWETYNKLNKNVDYEPKISIQLISNETNKQLIISDNGSGMTIAIIKNYFLHCGSSYRTSREWKNIFLNNENKSIISRNGRFGIGVMAGFLLGSKLKVQTRSRKSDLAYEFDVGLNLDLIQINKIDVADYGTKITIDLEDAILSRLLKNDKWRYWYWLKHPKLEIFNDLDEESLKILKYTSSTSYYDIPKYFDSTHKNWHLVTTDKFEKVFWSYDVNEEFPEFLHNGIVIRGATNLFKEFDTDPSIIVFDLNCNLNLSLDRHQIIGEYEFIQKIKELISIDILVKFYEKEFKNTYLNGRFNFLENEEFTHQALDCSLIYSTSGQGLKYFLPQSDNENILIIQTDEKCTIDFSDNYPNYIACGKIEEILMYKILDGITFNKHNFFYEILIDKEILTKLKRNSYSRWIKEVKKKARVTENENSVYIQNRLSIIKDSTIAKSNIKFAFATNTHHYSIIKNLVDSQLYGRKSISNFNSRKNFLQKRADLINDATSKMNRAQIWKPYKIDLP